MDDLLKTHNIKPKRNLRLVDDEALQAFAKKHCGRKSRHEIARLLSVSIDTVSRINKILGISPDAERAKVDERIRSAVDALAEIEGFTMSELFRAYHVKRINGGAK